MKSKANPNFFERVGESLTMECDTSGQSFKWFHPRPLYASDQYLPSSIGFWDLKKV
jgi:hypothetical protein